MSKIITEMQIVAPEGMQIDQESYTKGVLAFIPIPVSIVPKTLKDLDFKYAINSKGEAYLRKQNSNFGLGMPVINAHRAQEIASFTQLIALRDKVWMEDPLKVHSRDYVYSIHRKGNSLPKNSLSISLYHVESIKSPIYFSELGVAEEFLDVHKELLIKAIHLL